MRTSMIARRTIAAALLMVLPAFAVAAETPSQIRFKSGEMDLIHFLEMISESLDLSIDASALDGHLSERITVPEAGAMSPDRARALALTSLNLSGYTWIHDTATDLYRVARLRDARDQEVPLITDPAKLPDSDLLVTYVMPIQHSSPEFIARNMRSFMPAASRIIPNDMTRTVLITDTAHNISKLKKLVERLDNPQAAKEARKWLEDRAKESEADCPAPVSGKPDLQQTTLIALFSLIALVIGFLARGYVIRRIEGGL